MFNTCITGVDCMMMYVLNPDDGFTSWSHGESVLSLPAVKISEIVFCKFGRFLNQSRSYL